MTNKLEELLNQLINLHPKFIDLSLDRLLKLLKKLKNPHLNLPPIIHIAGTNGKGSTLSYIRYILMENNFLVHAYTSPHLKSFNERIILANKEIQTYRLLKVLEYIKKINNNEPITFFEITTAAAFYLFSSNKADFLILETGLGGRLDATNVIKKSTIDIITPIGIDHQEFLGNSILKITNEKLGIIKKGSKIVIARQNTKVFSHIKKKLKNFSNEKLFYDRDFFIIEYGAKKFKFKFKKEIKNINNPKLNGEHQIENASTAIATIFKLQELGYSFNQGAINKGIIKTKWPGRLEEGKLGNIKIFLDGAHNIEGAKQLLKYFINKNIKVWLIIGMLNNKNLYDFVKKIRPILLGVIAIKIPNEKNSFNETKIVEICNQIKIQCFAKKNINDANNFLLKEIKPKVVLISGSLYLVGKIRNKYL